MAGAGDPSGAGGDHRRRGEANRYFAGQAPWALKKTDPARMETVLWTTAEVVRRHCILCQPFMPGSAAKLLDLLAVPAGPALTSPIWATRMRWCLARNCRRLQGVFPRYVEQEGAA
jgi:methionyl-tRNA synthetase